MAIPDPVGTSQGVDQEGFRPAGGAGIPLAQEAEEHLPEEKTDPENNRENDERRD